MHTVFSQQEVSYYSHTEKECYYAFTAYNDLVHGFYCSDSAYVAFTGSRISEYLVTLSDHFSYKLLDDLPIPFNAPEHLKTHPFTFFSDSISLSISTTKSSPHGQIEIFSLLPQDNSFIRSIVFKHLGIDNVLENSTYPTLFNHLKENFENSYLKTNKELYHKYGDGCQACNWEKKIGIYPVYFDANTITVLVSRYVYTGGSNGMRTISTLNFSYSSDTLIKLNNLLDTIEIQGLQKRLNATLREQYRVTDSTPLTALGFYMDQVTMPDNYCLTPKGILFIFKPYEIAPADKGTITVFLPMNLTNKLYNYGLE